MARGVFTPSQIQIIQTKAEAMWRDSRAVKRPVHLDAVKAVVENQTARFTEITDSDKDNKVKVTWLEDCDIQTTELQDDCSIDGVELGSNSKEYGMNIGQQTTFKVDERIGRTNTYTSDEVIATGLMNRLNALDEYYAKRVLTDLKLASGVNAYPTPYTFNSTLKTTEVQEDKYNLKMVAHLLQQAEMNDISNPYFISDGLFFIDVANANFDAMNADGKGDYNRYQALNLYFDQRNFNKAGVEENLFMIDQSAVGLYTKAWYGQQPTLYAGDIQKTLYSVPSLNLPNVRYDVEYTMTCEKKGGEPKYYHVFKISTQGLFAVNPVACNDTSTGVLSYKRVDVPATEVEE